MEDQDEQLAIILPLIADMQSEQGAVNGKYAQALRSHDNIPPWAQGGPPNRLDSHPSDQSATWNDMIGQRVFPTPWRLALTIDVYTGPLGNGYVVTACTRVQGAEWCRSVGVGPEGRDVQWHETDAPGQSR